MDRTTQIIYDMLTFELQEMREAFESEAKQIPIIEQKKTFSIV